MVPLSRLVQYISIVVAVASAATLTTSQSKAFSGQQFTWVSPGNPYDGYIVQFVYPYGTVWVEQNSLGQGAELTFTVDSSQNLISHSKNLCLLDNGGAGYWVGDPTVFQDHPTCHSGPNWGLYRGAYLTLGGGYDMFCLYTNSGGDALLDWVPGIPAYEQGGGPCSNRGRVSVNGYSVQPAPKTPTPPTSTVAPPTGTAKPNPIITSLISTASSYLSKASVAAASYTNNATNSALASSAEAAIETAVLYIYNAESSSNDFSATTVAQKLDNTAEQLIKAAALAIAAQAVLTAAAASAFATAFNAVASIFASAVAAGNDPAQNPSPSSSMPSSSSSSSSPTPYVCTICIACTDSALPQPSETSEPDKRALEAPPMYLRDLHAGPLPTLAPRVEKKPTSTKTVPHIDAPAASTRDGLFCPSTTRVPVPNYASYTGAAGAVNQYNNYYNYFESSTCGKWNYHILSGSSKTFVIPANYQEPDADNYQTEHVYEIQTIPLFFKYAVSHDPLLSQTYGGSFDNFCQGLGAMMYSHPSPAFSQYQPYDYSTAPINQIYNQLQRDNEFVYLEQKINRIKATIFANNNPSIQATYGTALAYAARLVILEAYLNDPTVANLYKTVSSRIRNAIYQFGQACNSSTANPQYHQFGNINWLALYDAWESSYIDTMENIMRAQGLANARQAITYVNAITQNPRLTQQQRLDYIELRAYITGNYGNIGIISLSSLRR